MFELQKQAVPVDIVSSVSGGSIFAAALHSGVSPREFVKIVVDGRLNLARALASPTYVLPALTDAIIPRLQRGAWKYARDRSRRSENARLIERAFGQTKVFGLLRRICGSTTNDSEGSGSTLFFLRAREE